MCEIVRKGIFTPPKKTPQAGVVQDGQRNKGQVGNSMVQASVDINKFIMSK